jgi:hypothetical protein
VSGPLRCLLIAGSQTAVTEHVQLPVIPILASIKDLGSHGFSLGGNDYAIYSATRPYVIDETRCWVGFHTLVSRGAYLREYLSATAQRNVIAVRRVAPRATLCARGSSYLFEIPLKWGGRDLLWQSLLLPSIRAAADEAIFQLEWCRDTRPDLLFDWAVP